MTTSDRSLLLSDVFRKHRGRIYQYLRRRLANDADAQELAQETYLRLLRVNGTELVQNPQAYLYRIARNLVYEQNAKSLPAESWVDESELEALEHPDAAPEIQAERNARFELLERTLTELSPQHQAIVVLFCREGLSQSEIAERVGLSKSMVQKYLAGGIAHCRKRLKRFSEHP